MNKINLGKGRYIGHGFPAYIVAEVGINHNGDMDLAKRTIIAAKESGADAVKFQNYKTEDFVPIKTVKHDYYSQGIRVQEYQYDMFKRYELSDDHVIDLKNFCDKIEIDFHSTPTNFSGVDLLKKIGVNVLKNGSDYLTNLDLIKYMGLTEIPTVLSTGMALLGEIDDAVHVFKQTGNSDLILLHCTSKYPTPPQDVNLRKIPVLSTAFGVLSGFSDHSEGEWASVGSVCFGSVWIEKHFTLDKNLPGPDHNFSCDKIDFTRLVEGVRVLEQSLGVSALGPTESEAFSRENYRLSCAINKDVDSGYVIDESDIVFLRPGHGFPPKSKDFLIGREVRKPVKAYLPIMPGDLY